MAVKGLKTKSKTAGEKKRKEILIEKLAHSKV